MSYFYLVMKQSTSTYNPKSRKDISNPYWETPHSELLKKAQVKKFNGDYHIKTLANGRIIVEPKK